MSASDTPRTRRDEDVYHAVREAVVWAKADVIDLALDHISSDTLLAEAPICLDSLESVAMINRLEETLGLVAEDEHFFTHSVDTVGDVVAAVQRWIAAAGEAPR